MAEELEAEGDDDLEAALGACGQPKVSEESEWGRRGRTFDMTPTTAMTFCPSKGGCVKKYSRKTPKQAGKPKDISSSSKTPS